MNIFYNCRKTLVWSVFFVYLLICPLYSYCDTLKPSYPVFPFQDQGELTPHDINVQKYKMQRITIKQENENWFIIQGVNTDLTDEALLKLMKQTPKVEEIDSKKNLALTLSSVGFVSGAVGGTIMSNVIPFDNSIWVGLSFVAVGSLLLVIGEMVNPSLFEDISEKHFITMEEAIKLAEKYNKELAAKLELVYPVEN